MQKILLLSLCVATITSNAQTSSQPVKNIPVKVELKKVDSSFQLFRNGQPYFIKGAGGGAYPDRIAAYGGNSIRTWGTRNARSVLDSAAKYGLTVLMGLDVARERHGFNYDDTAAVRKQLQKLREDVLKYKDHPALAMN